MIYKEGDIIVQWGKGGCISWIPVRKKKNLHPYLTPYTRINSRWTANINVKDKTVIGIG